MGHQGGEHTLKLLRPRCFWVGIHEDVKQRCALTKMPNPKIHPSVNSFRPYKVVTIDFTLLEPPRDGQENVLRIINGFTKLTEVFPIRDQKAYTGTKVL